MSHRPGRSGWRAFTTLALASAVALAACGSSSKKTANAPGTTAGGPTTAASQPTKSPIKIGLLGAITGTSASGQQSLDKIAAAWQVWANGKGGINGHPVNVIFRDSANDAAKAAALAKELVEQDKVVAMVLADASAEDAIAPYLQQQKMPVVGGFGFSSNVWGKLDNFFTLKTDETSIVAGPLLAAKLVGAKTFGAVVCAENPSCAQAEQLYKPLTAAVGVNYAGLVTASFSSPSYTAQCLTLLGKKVDYIQINLTTVGATRLVSDCLQQGYTGTFGLADGTVLASAMTDVPADAKIFGVIDGFPWWVTDGPTADFHTAMDAAHLTVKDYGNSAETAVWSSLETFRKAMAQAPDNPTSADVFQAMYSLKNEDLGGLLPQKMNFTAGQPAPAVSCFWYYRYANGKFTTAPDSSSPSGNSVTSGDLKTSCYHPAGS
jgi:branched-chain amino acid transport system substrate-binding protein